MATLWTSCKLLTAETNQPDMQITCIYQNGRTRHKRTAPVLHSPSRSIRSAFRVQRSKLSPSSGQSMIEACLAMFIICLVFFGLFQISQLAAAREILHHAAARGARAKTVGFNRFMVSKAIRIASIPNAGKIISPEFVNEDHALRNMVATMGSGELWDEILTTAEPSSLQYDLERARIPEYMASENHARASFILDYEDWDSIGWSTPRDDSIIIELDVSQQYPLRIPMSHAFYAGSNVNIHGISSIENHHPLYLDDNHW